MKQQAEFYRSRIAPSSGRLRYGGFLRRLYAVSARSPCRASARNPGHRRHGPEFICGVANGTGLYRSFRCNTTTSGGCTSTAGIRRTAARIICGPRTSIVFARSVDRIHPHTMSLTDFLRFSGDRFSIYVLLDHMDWLASSESLLHDEWKAILDTALPEARIIYRSGGTSFDHVPEFARSRMEFPTGHCGRVTPRGSCRHLRFFLSRQCKGVNAPTLIASRCRATMPGIPGSTMLHAGHSSSIVTRFSGTFTLSRARLLSRSDAEPDATLRELRVASDLAARSLPSIAPDRCSHRCSERMRKKGFTNVRLVDRNTGTRLLPAAPQTWF